MPKRATRTKTTAVKSGGSGKRGVTSHDEDDEDEEISHPSHSTGGTTTTTTTKPRASDRRGKVITQTVVLDSDEHEDDPLSDHHHNNDSDSQVPSAPMKRPDIEEEDEEEETSLGGAGFHRRGKSAAAFADERASQLPKHQKVATPIKRKRPIDEDHEMDDIDNDDDHGKHAQSHVNEGDNKKKKGVNEEEEEQEVVYTEEDNIRILLATDNHLGYMERDPERGLDAIRSFEEILKKAKKYKVDMILLGGDLFHDNKPSRKTYYAIMHLLRQYCMGDEPCQLAILSENDFGDDQNGMANYYDPNLNISLPIFSIHGNHDDPSGDGNLAALDLLSVTGLMNYFGRSSRVDEINVKPICIQKGKTHLALYGISNVRDERLHRTFLQNKVTFMRPNTNEKWFNLLAFHQNRVAHGPTNHIPETFLPDWLHLILWGHEHECQRELSVNSEAGFYITQIGSSVATSLSEGESRTKHVALLDIRGQSMRYKPIKLHTVRPFLMRDVILSEVTPRLVPSDQRAMTKFLAKKVEEMVTMAKQEWVAEKEGREMKNAPKPLIRLRVEYSGGFDTFNPQRFGQQFVETVANPKEILQFFRKRSALAAGAAAANGATSVTAKGKKVGPTITPSLPEKIDASSVEELVKRHLVAQKLDILPEVEFSDAVRVYVDKDQGDAIKEFYAKSLEKSQKHLLKQDASMTEAELMNKAKYEKEERARRYSAHEEEEENEES